jgi:hypothetical protein
MLLDVSPQTVYIKTSNTVTSSTKNIIFFHNCPLPQETFESMLAHSVWLCSVACKQKCNEQHDCLSLAGKQMYINYFCVCMVWGEKKNDN